MNIEELIAKEGYADLVSLTSGGKAGLKITICFSNDIKLKPYNIAGKHVSEIMKRQIEYEKMPYYELCWNRYLMTSRRDEIFAKVYPEESFVGYAIRRFKSSRLLASISTEIQTIELLPAPVIHWGIYCLNDIVDVLAYDKPEVQKIDEV